MRFLPTRIHGALDYATGVLLIVAPWLFGFANGGAAQWVPVVLGVGVIGVALLTAYEWGMARVIPMPVHLGIDLVSGLLLLVSPWLFGFAALIWWPHVVIGVLEVGASLITQTVPGTDAGQGAHGAAL